MSQPSELRGPKKRVIEVKGEPLELRRKAERMRLGKSKEGDMSMRERKREIHPVKCEMDHTQLSSFP